MEPVYCYRCGTQVHNDYCHHCKKYNSGSPSLLSKLENKQVIKQKSFIDGFKNNMIICHPCHSCKYVMWHKINYCPKCGRKFGEFKGSYTEFMQSFSEYKTGY